MKTFFSTLLLGLFVIVSLTGCDEPKGPSFVYGSASINPGGSDDHINGDLTKSSGTDYYGYCSYSAKNGFSFTVGHADIENLDEVTSVDDPLYLKFEGITGAGKDGGPTEGVFINMDNENPKTGDEFLGNFKSATVKADDTFRFGPGDGDCKVELFAEPLKGEVLDNEDISNKTFEYYIRIYCNNMDVTSTETGLKLQNVYLEFYFDNC